MESEKIKDMSSWSGRGLYQVLLNSAKSYPDRIYFYSREKPISYARMCEISAKLSNYLCNHCKPFNKAQGGLPEGTVLGVSLDNVEHLLHLIWASLASGICLAFLPRTRDLEQMQTLMKQVNANCLVTDIPELLNESLLIPFESLEDIEISDHVSIDARELSPDIPAFIFPTSGTTGDPKWVQVTHQQFLMAIECFLDVGGLRHARDQVVYITPPLSHSYGLSSLLEYTLVGSSIILPKGSSPLGVVGEFQDPILINHVTAIEAVPYFYFQMSRLIEKIQLPFLQHIGTGGGALNLDAIDRIRGIYPKLTYSVRYGLTETPSVVSHKLFVDPYEDNWKSSGNILPLYELRIVDEAGRTLEPYREGEILLKGDCVALPYYGETEKSSDFFATGDIGYLDARGELFISGRKSLYLKSRGFRVSPEYIESMIGVFEGVKDCRVSMLDSVLLAEVVPLDHSFPIKELIKFLSKRLPNYAIPEKVIFVDSIPRTPSGKIKRG